MKKYLVTLGSAVSITFATIFVISFLIDPLRLYHKPWFKFDYYLNVHGMRASASGIINTEHFDSIILGTSMAENFSPKQASQLLGGEFVNISLGGSKMVEREIVLDYSLRQKRKLKNIIISLDWGSFKTAEVEKTAIFPFIFLYDFNKINDIMIYTLEPKVLSYFFYEKLFCKKQPYAPKCSKSRQIENLVEWQSNPEHNSRFGGLENWLAHKNNSQIKAALKSILASIDDIKNKDINQDCKFDKSPEEGIYLESIHQHARENSTTNFYLFFPPYSRIRYSIMAQSDPCEFDRYINFIKNIVHISQETPNVSIFGFEHMSFVDDIRNYKDTGHYHSSINSLMLKWMQKRKHQLTPENVFYYTEEIRRLAENYNLDNIKEAITEPMSNVNRDP